MDDYDLGNEMCNLEKSLYGCFPDEPSVTIDGFTYANMTDLRRAYYSCKIDAYLFFTMADQFTNGKIVSPIRLEKFYSGRRVIFNKLCVQLPKSTRIDHYLLVDGNDIHVSLQNSFIQFGDNNILDT